MDAEYANIEKLDRVAQWNMWRFQIKVILNASDQLHYIKDDVDSGADGVRSGGATAGGARGVVGVTESATGGKTQGGNDYDQKNVKNWLRGDRKAQKIIVMTLGQQPLMHIMNCKTARKMWCKLESIYETVHRLQQKFYNFQKDP